MASRAYGDRDYRAAVAVLRADVIPCARGCGRRATSPDHVPALADHVHVAGSGCCALVPSCAPCNLARGAATGNRRRRAVSRARLAPGSSVLDRGPTLYPAAVFVLSPPVQPDPPPVTTTPADGPGS